MEKKQHNLHQMMLKGLEKLRNLFKLMYMVAPNWKSYIFHNIRLLNSSKNVDAIYFVCDTYIG